MKTHKRLTKEIVEMKARGLSYQDIGKLLGVSRQRVQQYFSPCKKTMLSVAERAQTLCEQCGQFDMFGCFHHKVYDYDILNEPENIIYLCTTCHLKLRGEYKTCLNCGIQYKGTKKGDFCCIACKVAYNSIPVRCSNCNKDFVLTASQKIRIIRSKSGLLFCTKRCQGIYTAEHYGFGVNPEHARGHRTKGKSKYISIIPAIRERISQGKPLDAIIKKMVSPPVIGC